MIHILGSFKVLYNNYTNNNDNNNKHAGQILCRIDVSTDSRTDYISQCIISARCLVGI